MFWKKKPSNEGDNGEDEPQFKRPGHRIFGFQCSPDIQAGAKALAKEMNVDLYVVAEHAIQLGLINISAAIKDPAERETLRVHLHNEHAMKHLIESVSVYDNEAAEYIRAIEIRRHHREQAIRELVELWSRYNLDPRLLKEMVLRELKKMFGPITQ